MIEDLERFEDHPEYKQKVEEYTEKLKDLELSEGDLIEIIALNRTIFKLQMMVHEILKKANLKMEQELKELNNE